MSRKLATAPTNNNTRSTPAGGPVTNRLFKRRLQNNNKTSPTSGNPSGGSSPEDQNVSTSSRSRQLRRGKPNRTSGGLSANSNRQDGAERSSSLSRLLDG